MAFVSTERQGYQESFHFSHCHYRSKVSKAETIQELHKTPASPATHLHQSPPLCKHSYSPCSQSLELQREVLNSALERWLERGCSNQTMEENFQPSQFTPRPLRDHSCEPAPIPCRSMVKNAFLFSWSSWILLIWIEKHFYFLLFSYFTWQSVCLFKVELSLPLQLWSTEHFWELPLRNKSSMQIRQKLQSQKLPLLTNSPCIITMWLQQWRSCRSRRATFQIQQAELGMEDKIYKVPLRKISQQQTLKKNL